MDTLIFPQLQTPRAEINVLYTTYQGTKAALAAAHSLSKDLEVRVRVLAFQVVPYQAELVEPTVCAGIVLKRILTELTRTSPDREFTVHYILCRDHDDALVRSLSRDSLVVIGGRRGFVASRGQRIARKLETIGHEVVFVPTNGAPEQKSWTCRCRDFVLHRLFRPCN